MAKDIPDYMRGFDTTDDWGFTPVSSKPGDSKPAVDKQQLDSKFEGTNISGKTITATADFVADPENISPYLIKTECFCFIEQTLEPGESKTFTMVFFIDSSIDDNSLFDDLNQITLTYKFSEFAS